MCGIAGSTIFGLQEGKVNEISRGFVSALDHRGPDGNGIWSDQENMLLVHTRLAIIDLSTLGSQPMSSASGRYVLTYNGEIYNFKALRRELESVGVHFYGSSDTEVLLALIERYGVEKSLLKIEGMFAFALFDRFRKELYLARDHLGQKPLYYGWLNNQFCFASELKALKSIGGEMRINKSIIPDFLAYGYVPSPFSIYDNIYKLVPGSYLMLSLDGMSSIKDNFSPELEGATYSPIAYWRLTSMADMADESQAVNPNDSSAVLSGLSDLLNESVRDHLVSDVEVGCFLSGGIDSSLISALAQRESKTQLKTFTIGFEDKEFDESRYAKKIASYIGSEHYQINMAHKEVVDVIDILPNIYDEPFADPSQLPSVLVAKAAKNYVSVCLSGDGGDELFCGYNRYTAAYRAKKFSSRCPVFLRKLAVKILLNIDHKSINRVINFAKLVYPFRFLAQTSLTEKIKKLAFVLDSASDAELYDFLLRLNGLDLKSARSVTEVERRAINAFGSGRDFLDVVMLFDQLNYLVDDNLVKVDRSSMFNSLEVRLPLLDKRVVEKSWCLSNEIKVFDGKGKWPLRNILQDLIPQELFERPKMGFSTPLGTWISSELKSWCLELLNDGRGELGGLVDLQHFRSLYEDHCKGYGDYSLTLWPVFVLSQWLRANSKD